MLLPHAVANVPRVPSKQPGATVLLLSMLIVIASCMPEFPPAGKLVPLKLDEPKDAALTFVRAIGAGDVETAKAASLGTDRQKRWAIDTANMVNGLRAFDDAMNIRFGLQAAGTHMNIVNALNSLTVDPEDAVTSADVKMHDDRRSAEIVAVSRIYAVHMVYASRVRKDQQGWKVDLPAILENNPQFAKRNDSPDLDKLAEIGSAMRNLAAKIKAGAYPTVDAAEAAAAEISPGE
jgi:hypothetical protein